MVNRVWQHHFGRGIVATPSNFGTRGAPPSHPELLDWLTATFIEHGWSIKSLHRLIMQSKTYQLASDCKLGRRGDRPGQPVVLAVQPPAARRRGDSRRHARRERRVGLFPPGAAPVSADSRMALDAALPVQRRLSVQPPQRVPDDAAAPPPSVSRPLRRPRHEHDDRRPLHIDRSAASLVLDERQIDPRHGKRLRRSLVPRRTRPRRCGSLERTNSRSADPRRPKKSNKPATTLPPTPAKPPTPV